MSKADTHIFGPVPSRRLGLSLGVDLIPHKICTLDCLYCQVGYTTCKSVERKSFVDLDRVLQELQARLACGPQPDYITLSGSGEPTLNRDLGQFIQRIKDLTPIPIALITNGTLMNSPAVREECRHIDVILPSLDAANESLFQQVNRPHPSLTVENHIAGLEALRREYPGQIWLEVFLIDRLNTAPDHLTGLRSLIARLRPDRVHLNTAVRPTANPQVRAVPAATLARIARTLGPICEVVADFHRTIDSREHADSQEAILTLLQRRPCTAPDIADGLGIELDYAKARLEGLVKQGKLRQSVKSGRTFYQVPDVISP